MSFGKSAPSALPPHYGYPVRVPPWKFLTDAKTLNILQPKCGEILGSWNDEIGSAKPKCWRPILRRDNAMTVDKIKWCWTSYLTSSYGPICEYSTCAQKLTSGQLIAYRTAPKTTKFTKGVKQNKKLFSIRHPKYS